MSDTPSKMQRTELPGLLCPQTLKSVFRNALDSNVSAREGIKGLLSRSSAPPPPVKNTDSESARWEHCLNLLVEDFIARKTELSRLNKARRIQIEEFLRQRAGFDLNLETAIQSRIGSQEHETLRLFAYQVSVFLLLQILLLKRWQDSGLSEEKVSRAPGQTINWQITTFLKRNARKGMIGRHDWSFLKQNIYSWFAPSKDAQERLRLLLEPVTLSGKDGGFPSQLLNKLGGSSRLSLLGFNPGPMDSHSLWRLLLEVKSYDQRLSSVDQLDFASPTSGALLLSGLRNGESLNSLRELTAKKELHDVWAFTDSEFERYLSEIFILWDAASEVPRINIHPRTLLQEAGRAPRSVPLFQEGLTVPYQAQLAACFNSSGARAMEDSCILLDRLRENGLLLLESESFWPTDVNEESEKAREAVLRGACLRLIIDLRQLSAENATLPKGIFILEKCSSKEVRDSNRPQILRVRGQLSANNREAFWAAILECVRHESAPGEVLVKSISSAAETVKIEVMSAAASQQQLRSSPWTTLSDPAFYEASGRLRRSPSKAFALGTILRWKSEMNLPSPRSILLQEHPKHLLAAAPGKIENLSEDLAKFLFVPDSNMVEHANFFMAQLYSAPIQFWYRLETEQNIGKKTKPVERQTEQRLKLMPFLRLFEPGTLLSAPSPNRLFASLDEARSSLTSIFRQPSLGLAERSKLHEIIVSLEHSVSQNIENCAELTKHIFPEVPVTRWSLPSQLPPPSPQLVFNIFKHLDHSAIQHHPAVHVTRLRNVNDFKVTNVSCEDMPMGGISELKIFHGVDPVLRLNGPTLLLKAALTEIQQRIGRPWREISALLQFPTDFMLVRTQLQEVIKSIESQLQFTRDHIAVIDQVFCCLFGITNSFTDESVRQTMRHHLSPDDSKITLLFNRDAQLRPVSSETPIGFLQ